MSRKPRIHIPGYYHVINRGVNREDIFLEDDSIVHLDPVEKLSKEDIRAFFEQQIKQDGA